MREWITSIADSQDVIDEVTGLSDKQVIDFIDRHYEGGARVFRYCVKNGVQP